jgi:uncharacterized membrane protein
MVGGFISMFLMFFVMFGGAALSAFGSAAAGDQDAAAAIGAMGSLVSFGLMFAVIFVLIAGITAVTAPLSGSLTRAIAAHQRGEGKLDFKSVFSTASEGILPACLVTGAVMLATFLGIPFCYVGALVPAMLFGFAGPLVFLHRLSPGAALGRSARTVMANPGPNILYTLTVFGIAMVAGYVPVVGMMFLLAFTVRGYRQVFGDGAEPAEPAA